MNGNTGPETHRCGVLKVGFIDAKLVKWYDNFQKDYQKFIKILFNWSGIGYCRTDKDGNVLRDENGNYCYVTSEQAIAQRNQSFQNNAETISTVESFISSIFEKDGSYYSLFYPKFKPEENVRFTKSRVKLLEAIRDNDEKEKKKFKSVPKEVWEIAEKEFQSGKNIDDVWKCVAEFFRDNTGKLGSCLRKKFNFTNFNSENNPYCVLLAQTLVRQLRSLKEKYELHVTEYEELRTEVENYQNDQLFNLMKDLSQDLESINYGLNKAVVGRAVKDILENKIETSYYRPAIEILVKDKYQPLITASFKERMSAYGKFKKYRNFLNRRKYPIRPAICDPEDNLNAPDVKIMFEVNQKGKFRLDKVGDKTKVSIGEIGSLMCMKSCYMSDLSFELSKDGTQYDVTFRHESRIDRKLAEKRAKKQNPVPIKAPGDWIKGAVKSIGLQKKGDHFYLTLPYDINFPEYRQNLADLFIKTEKLDKEKLSQLPKKFVASGVDLNIGNPIAVSTGEFHYMGDGPIQNNGPISALDYGCGDLIKKPFFGAQDGDKVRKIVAIRNGCSKLKRVIRQYKTSLKKYMFGESNEFAIEESMMKWLTTASKISKETKERLEIIPDEYNKEFAKNKLAKISARLTGNVKPIRVPLIDHIRPYIEAKLAKINKLLGRFHKEERDTGYKNISHLIRLFEASDNYHSLIQSYQRIHLLPGESLVRRRSINMKRQNWRLFVSRKIAAHVVNATKGSDVVFLEDLSTNYDRDNDNNSLARLFSGPTLVKIIKQSLNKAGMAVVFVDPAGTSKTDPLTGNIGKRFYQNKSDLIVNRNGVDVRIDADLAASLNVMLKGLSHNVAKYSFWSGKDEDKELAKRVTRFFREKFNCANPKFVNNNNIVEARAKAKKGDCLPNQKLYYRNNRIVTVEEHHKEQQEIESRCAEWHKLPRVDVTPDNAIIYENFRI